MMTEKERVRVSAVLCGRWNRLCADIENKRTRIRPVPDAKAIVTKEAEEYAEKHEKSAASFCTTLLRSVLLYLVIPACPILAIFVAYKLGLNIDFLKEYGEYFSLLVFGLVIIDGVIDYSIQKGKKQRIIDRYVREHIEEYTKKSEAIRKSNENIRSAINTLAKKKALLEREMRDRSVCCIHPDYWYAAPQLYYLMDCGRAETLKEAINLFEHIQENERRRLAAEAAAEEQRWAKIEDMLEEGERMEKLKRVIRSAIYDVF